MDLLADLTPPQREAVTHIDGPLLVLAGAGSGKTRVITRRVAYLLSQGIPAHQILAITFTNKAADEMRSRIATLTPARGLTVATFHSFCARVLRSHHDLARLDPSFVIYTQADSKRAVKRAIESLSLDTTNWSPDKIQSRISHLKNRLETVKSFTDRAVDYSNKTVARIWAAYQEGMAANNALDFDDLLERMAIGLRENEPLRDAVQDRYRYILIDEYQDTNEAQYLIAKSIATRHRNICATGDPDQSIYGWRGANINNILDFEKEFVGCRVIRLEQNYRSTPQILAAASELIRHNVKRKEKGLHTQNPAGPPVRVIETESGDEEARRVAELIREDHPGNQDVGRVAVFYRVNSLSRALEDALRSVGIPYEIVRGTSFYERQEIRALVAYLRALVNPADDQAIAMIINTPTRGIGDTTLKRLADFAAERSISLLEACRMAATVDGLNGRAIGAVQKFVELMDDLAEQDRSEVAPLVQYLLDKTAYSAYCRKLSDGDKDRELNVEEFLNVAVQFDRMDEIEVPEADAPELSPLQGFLERMSLASDQDQVHEGSERVHLMTLHAAKGLEFPTVFIVGCEDGLLPHQMAMEDDSRDIEEERRLCFVGMTRAQKKLTMTHARYRMHQGQTMRSGPSAFLREIGNNGVQRESMPSSGYEGGSGGGFGGGGFGGGGFGRQGGFRRGRGGGGYDDEGSGIPSRWGGKTSGVTRRYPAPKVDREARQYEPTEEEAARLRAAIPATDSPYRVGQRVSHPTYGAGVVASISGSGEQMRLRIRFQTVGEKVIAPAFAKLSITG